MCSVAIVLHCVVSVSSKESDSVHQQVPHFHLVLQCQMIYGIYFICLCNPHDSDIALWQGGDFLTPPYSKDPALAHHQREYWSEVWDSQWKRLAAHTSGWYLQSADSQLLVCFYTKLKPKSGQQIPAVQLEHDSQRAVDLGCFLLPAIIFCLYKRASNFPLETSLRTPPLHLPLDHLQDLHNGKLAHEFDTTKPDGAWRLSITTATTPCNCCYVIFTHCFDRNNEATFVSVFW